MREAESRLRLFVKNNNRLPSYAMMKMYESDPARAKLEKTPILEVCGMFHAFYNFWVRNGRWPNYVSKVYERATPTTLNYQLNGVQCCPASLSMVSTKLFRPKEEGVKGKSGLAQVLGTGDNGTSPAQLIAGAAKVGFRVVRIPRNPAAVKAALDKYHGVMTHFETKPSSSCSGFINNYGHWGVLDRLVNGRYETYDPTKGVYWCPTGVMDRATNGRDIGYYEVSLL